MTQRCSRCDIAHEETNRCPTDLEYERGYRAGFDRGSKESLKLLSDERRAVTELEKHLSAAECGNVSLRQQLAAAEAAGRMLASAWEAKFNEIEQQLATARGLLREIYAKSVRNKHNIHWHEVTLTDDKMAEILKAAGGGE